MPLAVVTRQDKIEFRIIVSDSRRVSFPGPGILILIEGCLQEPLWLSPRCVSTGDAGTNASVSGLVNVVSEGLLI